MTGRARHGFLGILAALFWAAAGAGVAVADERPDTRFFAEANRLHTAAGRATSNASTRPMEIRLSRGN
jgi:hypothetical protein